MPGGGGWRIWLESFPARYAVPCAIAEFILSPVNITFDAITL